MPLNFKKDIFMNWIKFKWRLLGAALLWLVFVQVLFYLLQKNQGERVERTLASQLRQELEVSNYHLLSRHLTDLASMGALECAYLQLMKPKEILLLDMRYKGNCFASNWQLRGHQLQTQLVALNGDLYQLEALVVNGPLFELSLWLTRLLGLVFIVMFFTLHIWAREKQNYIFKLESQHAQELIEASAQVAHDVRSPLSALNMMIKSIDSELPLAKRGVILGALNRINDIVNLLLIKNNKAKEQKRGGLCLKDEIEEGQPDSPYLLNSLLESLVSEKRAQYLDRLRLQILLDHGNSMGSFVRINATELKRVVSNLINNAVEATEHLASAIVRIEIDRVDNQVLIRIIDKGPGMPQSVLQRWGERGLSVGKETKPEAGSGLGLFHAKKTIESAGGKMIIKNQAAGGVDVQLWLKPESNPPVWFVPKLTLCSDLSVFILDDEPSMHEVWNHIFRRFEHLQLKLHHFTRVQDFLSHARAEPCLYLVDYELKNQGQIRSDQQPIERSSQNLNGIDLILKLNLQKHAILVTSRFEDPEVQQAVQKHSLKMIAKNILPYLPVGEEN